MKQKSILKLGLFVLVLLLIVACDNRNGIEEEEKFKISRFEADVYQIFADNGDTNANLEAQVVNQDGFPIEGKEVLFRTSFGNITASATTDTAGIAKSVFTDSGTESLEGLSSRTAYVEAFVGSNSRGLNIVVEKLSSSEVSSIQFQDNNEVILNVAGTGGNSTYDLEVQLLDRNGNPVEEQREVWFKLLYGPEGTNIDESVYTYTDSINSISQQDGIASIPINAGSVAGPVAVKAYVIRNQSMISANKPNITVVSGPPEHIELSIGDNNSGTDVGAGVWEVEIAASVTDLWGNDVQSGVNVHFSIPDDHPNQIPGASGWGLVFNGDGFIGNENSDGDSIPGVAFSTLTYNGIYSNRQVLVNVLTVDGHGNELESNTVLTLPFHNLSIDMLPTPQHIDWVNGNNPQRQYARVRTSVIDGQDNPINDLTVVFYGTLGHPYGNGVSENFWQEDTVLNSDDDPFTEVTGAPHPYLNNYFEAGHIFKRWSFEKYECPEPTAAGPGQTTSTVTAHVLGDNTSNSVTIILIRYVE